MLTLIIHEAGHMIAALLCGAPVHGIRTRVGGLSLLCRADALSYPRAAIVYAGGAAANLLTAAVFYRSGTFAAFSVGAAVFNLLPLPGSDGVNIISALLSCSRSAHDDPGHAERIVRAISDAAVFAFWGLAVYISITGRGGMTLLLFAVGLIVYRLGADDGAFH